MSPDATPAERAAAGARDLDKRQPGWAERINLRILDLSVYDKCILGQLFGSYVEGKRAIVGHKQDWDQAVALGYSPKRIGYMADSRALDEAWTREVLTRTTARDSGDTLLEIAAEVADEHPEARNAISTLIGRAALARAI